MEGVKSIYPEGSKEEALVYSNVIDLFWKDTQERRLWLLDEYYSYLKRNNIEIEERKSDIEDDIVESFERHEKRVKNRDLEEENIQIEKYSGIAIEEILEAYKEEGYYINEYDLIDIRSNKSDDEEKDVIDENLIFNQSDFEITSFSQDIFNLMDYDED